eukprot:6202352-Pleurochrysis_carterae.AAC.2
MALVSFLLCPGVTDAALPIRKEVHLPGVPGDSPYTYFSGYLPAGTPPSGRGELMFHYICAMSEGWESKPLTLWIEQSTSNSESESLNGAKTGLQRPLEGLQRPLAIMITVRIGV